MAEDRGMKTRTTTSLEKPQLALLDIDAPHSQKGYHLLRSILDDLIVKVPHHNDLHG